MVFHFQRHIYKQSRFLAKVNIRIQGIQQRPISHGMPTKMNPQAIYSNGGTANMAYTHCKTRIINLVDLNIPDSASELQYKEVFHQICKSKISIAQTLTDAISSVSTGIAPPVAFPTETVYGLGADATNRASIAGIFAAKGRPSDNPLIVHVASQEHLERLTGEPIPSVYSDLVKDHWPGPLTILVPIPKQNSVFAENVHPGQKTIGFRVPDSKYARFFIAATGKPIAAPSANSSGKPSPTTAQHVMDDLRGKINFILDGGNCDVGVESTVVDGLHDPPLILRPGGLSQDDLISHGKKYSNAWANVGIGYKQVHEDHDAKANGAVLEEAPRAPGMKYKHYAPQGRMVLFDGRDSVDKVQAELDLLIDTVGPATNGIAQHTQESTTLASFNIAVLTSTSWPAYANLPVKANIAEFTTTTKNISSVATANGLTSSSEVGTTNTVQSATYRGHRIHSLPLGSSPKQIAQNLFAALRTCDDLGCRFILAEGPSRAKVQVIQQSRDADSNEIDTGSEVNVAEQLHRFDAVSERMRKAASLVVN